MAWNKRSTFLWLLLSIAITVGLTGVLWFVFQVPFFVGFLFLPFLFSGARWFGGRRKARSEEPWTGGAGGTGGEPEHRVCPVCGWRAKEPGDRYCPRDGTLLR